MSELERLRMLVDKMRLEHADYARDAGHLLEQAEVSRDAYRDQRDAAQRERDLAVWLHAEAVWQRDQAEAEAILRQATLKGLTVEEGAAVLELGPPRELVIAWVDAARKMLGDAENYSETRIDFPRESFSMEIKAAGEVERYVFTVQRAGRLTPHEARSRAEADRDAERESRFRWAEEAAELKAKLDLPCGSCHPCTNWADETWRRADRKSAPAPAVDRETLRNFLVGHFTPHHYRDVDPDNESTMLVYQDADGQSAMRALRHTEIADALLARYDIRERGETQPVGLPDGAALIAAKRRRVVDVKGWTPEHDDQHVRGELLDAARCYANQGRTWFPEFTYKYDTDDDSMSDQDWPWWAGGEIEGWYPSSDPIENLVNAGQLIAAEIDRLQRAERGDQS